MRIKTAIAISVLLPAILLGQNYGLGELIDRAYENNQMLKSKALNIQSKEKELEAQESSYWPTLDIGASYDNANPATPAMPGETLTGFASLGFELYDGGRRSSLVNAKNFYRQASLFERKAFEKSLALDIVNEFYGIKKLEANLNALNASAKELKAQIERIKKFAQAGMATEEDVDRLQAAYDDNVYLIESTKLDILSSEENLWLRSGIKTRKFKNSRFAEPGAVRYEHYEKTKILQNNAAAIGQQANAVDSAYLPQVKLEDTYRKSDFNRVKALPGDFGDAFFVNNQNRLGVTANMRLFDYGRLRKEREALQYQKMSLDSQAIYSRQEQQMNFRIAKSRLKTMKAKLRSAKSGLRAAKSTYAVIIKKFETGLVDNIAYLDALKKQTSSEALYKSTVYDYEIAKSIYYFYAGQDPRRYIR